MTGIKMVGMRRVLEHCATRSGKTNTRNQKDEPEEAVQTGEGKDGMRRWRRREKEEKCVVSDERWRGKKR